MAVGKRLHVDAEGKLQGPAWLTHNHPFPCPNGQGGLTPPMSGAVMHTNVGNLPGTVAVFNHPGFDASAHFEIGGPWEGHDGHIWQFGPVNGWEAWHCMSGNNMWFGIEHSDGGNPDHPLSHHQLTASAQVLEALAHHQGWEFPLDIAHHPGSRGYGAHYMGGQGWGGHTCPDPAPGGEGPRSHQRAEIIRRANIIHQHGQYPAPTQAVLVSGDGKQSLVELAAAHKLAVSTLIRYTIDHQGRFTDAQMAYFDGANLNAPVPGSLTWCAGHAEKNGLAHKGGVVITSPEASLKTVAQVHQEPISTILRWTTEQLGLYDTHVSQYLQMGDLTSIVPVGAKLVVS